MIEISTPINDEIIKELNVGDRIYISGDIICGRDAALPKLVDDLKNNNGIYEKHDISGGVIFHTAISVAGLGPTSSNKLEIENSIGYLSKSGIKVHLGKGKLKDETVKILEKYNSIYAVIPPVTALLTDKVIEKKLLDYPELKMEGLYLLKVDKYPAIVAAAKGRSIYD